MNYRLHYFLSFIKRQRHLARNKCNYNTLHILSIPERHSYDNNPIPNNKLSYSYPQNNTGVEAPNPGLKPKTTGL